MNLVAYIYLACLIPNDSEKKTSVTVNFRKMFIGAKKKNTTRGDNKSISFTTFILKFIKPINTI